MSVEKDLNVAIDMIKKNKVDKRLYRKVKILPDYSTKHFKKLRVDNKNILSRVNNYSEIADLLLRGESVTCYSTNIFDKYFLNLFLATLTLFRKDHLDFYFPECINKNSIFNYDLYTKIRDKLSDDTKFFFDNLYNMFDSYKIYFNLVERSKYTYNQIEPNISYLIPCKYNKINNKDIKCEFVNLTTSSVIKKFQDRNFDFINMSTPIDTLSNEKYELIFSRIKDLSNILTENGQILGFVGRDENIILPEFKILETRSITDQCTELSECKKDYAYVYSKSK